MRRRMWFLLALCLLLTLPGCSEQPAAQPGKDSVAFAEVLAFPGTRWNMTPEELVAALNLTEGSYTVAEDTLGSERLYTLRVDRISAFGADASVAFQFADYTGGGVYGLEYVLAAYPDGADMLVVRAAMEQTYGQCSPADESRSLVYNAHVTRWQAETLLVDCLPQEQVDTILSKLRGKMPIAVGDIQTTPLANAGWSDRLWLLLGIPEEDWPYEECNGLVFSSGICGMLQTVEEYQPGNS